MAPPHPKIDAAPEPARVFFDPYNSTSTGHQRAETRVASSISWRDSRTYKLAHQFKDRTGAGGQLHLSTLIERGNENYGKDGQRDQGVREQSARGPREPGCQDVRELMKSRKRKHETADETNRSKRQKSEENASDDTPQLSGISPPGIRSPRETSGIRARQAPNDHDPTRRPIHPPPIFRGLTLYLNGSVAPLISDHKLKQLFAQHGGNAAIALGRRSVTHVVLGDTCGGGLAAGKIQKEVARVGGKGIMYVTAQWVVDSVAKGVRQSEAKYVPRGVERIGGSRQASVMKMFQPVEK